MDWKKGAVDYLTNLIRNDGAHNEDYHLIKPFLGGPDYTPFFDELYRFLNMTERLKMSMRSKVLDVGCGPGWVAQYLSKLGHRVVGIDICQDLIDIAERRIKADPLSCYPGEPLDARFYVHDVERDPIPEEERFDVAFFESTLHHFYDPVAVLRNVGNCLKPGGLICVLEAAAPEPGSEPFNINMEIMEKYHTMERPYTRKQLETMLDLTGFKHREFFSAVNGFFNTDNAFEVMDVQNKLRSGAHWNNFIASRDGSFFKGTGANEKLSYVRGFFGAETLPDGGTFRWSGPSSEIMLKAVSRLSFKLSTDFVPYEREFQSVFIYLDQHLLKQVKLTPGQKNATVDLDIPAGAGMLSFASDSCFCPKWFNSPDDRMLSFVFQELKAH